jgi:guanosine-3',5'-bis(diphosphate) 3'-pyrophosphohydrolase
VLADIGLGKRLPAIVARRLAEGVEEGTRGLGPGSRRSSPILIHGAEGVAVQVGHCCRPIPGDPIVGLIRKGHGLVVQLASEIADTGSNIVNVSMDEDTGEATTLFFTLQVTDRIHLALILRALRRIPEVIRITRYVDSKH